MAEGSLSKLKFILRESEMPMFSDEELQQYMDEADSFDTAVYELLLMKSENTGLSISGLSIQDTSSYFKRLALMHKPTNSGILGG